MYSTSLSLLEKLRNPHDAAAWDRFVELYLPLLFCWARRLRLTGGDPHDFVQDVFVKLMHELPTFNYDPAAGRFRSWLRRVCENHWHDLRRKRGNLLVQADDAQLAALEDGDDLEQFWTQEYQAVLIREAFRLIDGEFEETTKHVFRAVVLEGRAVQDVAQELALSPNAVSMRKFRVLRRLHQELGGFLE